MHIKPYSSILAFTTVRSYSSETNSCKSALGSSRHSSSQSPHLIRLLHVTAMNIVLPSFSPQSTYERITTKGSSHKAQKFQTCKTKHELKFHSSVLHEDCSFSFIAEVLQWKFRLKYHQNQLHTHNKMYSTLQYLP